MVLREEGGGGGVWYKDHTLWEKIAKVLISDFRRQYIGSYRNLHVEIWIPYYSFLRNERGVFRPHFVKKKKQQNAKKEVFFCSTHVKVLGKYFILKF